MYSKISLSKSTIETAFEKQKHINLVCHDISIKLYLIRYPVNNKRAHRYNKWLPFCPFILRHHHRHHHFIVFIFISNGSQSVDRMGCLFPLASQHYLNVYDTFWYQKLRIWKENDLHFKGYFIHCYINTHHHFCSSLKKILLPVLSGNIMNNCVPLIDLSIR